MCNFLLSLALVVPVQAAPERPAPKGPVFRGIIADVRGVADDLMLRPRAGAGKGRTFRIPRARIVGPSGDEWKVGDLQAGDRVEVETDAASVNAREVRVTRAVKRVPRPGGPRP
jgi:hypothetical protein